MIDHLQNEQLPTRPTPLDIARIAVRFPTIVTAETENSPDIETAPDEHKAGDIIERDGEKFMLAPELYWAEAWVDRVKTSIQVPYTYAQYYAHTFETTVGRGGYSNGPGWDGKFSLLNPERSINLHDRVFTDEELVDLPANLPTTECLFVRKLDSDQVAEYLEYVEQVS